MNALDITLLKRLKEFVGQRIEGVITSNLMNENPYVCFIQPDGVPTEFTLEFDQSDCTFLCFLHEVSNGNNFYKIETKEGSEIKGNVLLRINVGKKIDNIEYFTKKNKFEDFNDIGAFIFHFHDKTKMLFVLGSFLPQLSITIDFKEIESLIRTLLKEGYNLKKI